MLAISFSRRTLRPGLAAALVATAALWFGCSAALAQSAACSQLDTMLQSLDANPAYRDAGQSAENLMALQANERNAEQAYVRTGCQAAQDTRQPQTPQCRGIARQILSERAQISQLQQSAGTGGALAGQRQQIMRQMARYGCVPATSGANFSGTSEPPRRSFLDQLFGGPSQDDYGDDTDQPPIDDMGQTPSGQGTIRTMCVRLSDGYYWPISYSTTQDYIPQDASTCQSECPNQQVQLYFYANPGQDPTQMVDATGDRYVALPSAFAYRKQFDLKNSCGAQAALEGGNAGTSDATAPQPVTATAASNPIDIPLPRPRPGDPDAPSDTPAATPVATTPPPPAATRVVRVGDKLVRLVGPETPYAPQTADPG